MIKVNGDNYPELREGAGGAEQRAKGREGKGGKGGEIKNPPRKERRPPAVTLGLWFQAAPCITSKLQTTIPLPQTHDNIVRNQELKYSVGPRPPLRGGMAGERPQEREGTQGAPASARASSVHTRQAPASPWLPGPRRLRRVIGTCSAEGKGLAAIGSAVSFICTL